MERAQTERPRQSGPHRFGPYRLLTRLDPTGPGFPAVAEQRFIARSADGERTVLISAPHEGADAGRFLVEADAARRLQGPWTLPVTELSPTPEAPWYACPYLPLLPLPVALAVHGGPLPERTVRALGAALAETLAGAHAAGMTHAGVSPTSVLLAWDGPRLTCFGAARAAAPDGERRTGLLGLEPGSLAPEAAAGGRPRPPGDIHGLGAVLAYAATGHTVPDSDELPDFLRPLIARCLTRDAAARPTAPELLHALPPSSAAPAATVLDSAGALLAPGWLPGRVVAAIARQSSEVLAAEVRAPRTASRI
ncbi:serine/threonine protein kinase [Streptomyces sp. Tu 2975]|uniref:serine/threonine protein kinase n=1 Tax=Streptomyces sp. Tu 2975 TaxID=2676871 RepID=UPI001359477D|nr:serine/threonine protein kinase [Streptomyces sp. Tu 2975]QIP86275.1 serine/threonine protein kinase [Streptomyces sp. Tu 2975]